MTNLLDQFSEENSEGMHRIPGGEYFQYLNETNKTPSFPEYLRESDEALIHTSSRVGDHLVTIIYGATKRLGGEPGQIPTNDLSFDLPVC